MEALLEFCNLQQQKGLCNVTELCVVFFSFLKKHMLQHYNV